MDETKLHTNTHCHLLLLVMSPWISNQHKCVTRVKGCLIDGCMKSPLLCCVFVREMGVVVVTAAAAVEVAWGEVLP